MGYFDLPTGEVELLLKKKGRGRFKEEWKNVAMTDYIDYGNIAELVERWSKNYKVLGARYNGRNVTIPTEYHWEHRYKDDVYGVYKTRAEVVEAMEKRRQSNWKEKDKTKRVPVGLPKFVKD